MDPERDRRAQAAAGQMFHVEHVPVTLADLTGCQDRAVANARGSSKPPGSGQEPPGPGPQCSTRPGRLMLLSMFHVEHPLALLPSV